MISSWRILSLFCKWYGQGLTLFVPASPPRDVVPAGPGRPAGHPGLPRRAPPPPGRHHRLRGRQARHQQAPPHPRPAHRPGAPGGGGGGAPPPPPLRP